MSKFTKWLVDNDYTTSEDADTIRGELSGAEADTLYDMFIAEGNLEDD